MEISSRITAFALFGLLFQGAATGQQQLPAWQQLLCNEWPPEYNYAFESAGSFLLWATQIIEATLYRADVSNPMAYSATGIPLGLQRPNGTYTMSLCERQDVAKCLYYGEGTSPISRVFVVPGRMGSPWDLYGPRAPLHHLAFLR